MRPRRRPLLLTRVRVNDSPKACRPRLQVQLPSVHRSIIEERTLANRIEWISKNKCDVRGDPCYYLWSVWGSSEVSTVFRGLTTRTCRVLDSANPAFEPPLTAPILDARTDSHQLYYRLSVLSRSDGQIVVSLHAGMLVSSLGTNTSPERAVLSLGTNQRALAADVKT